GGVAAPGGRGVGAMPVAEVSAPSAVDVASRIARALELQDARAGQPLTHMLLRLENAAGTEDRIRVDLRGGNVGATLDIGSVADAGGVRARVEDVARALARHGLETESVRIRTTATATVENAELMRVAAALGEGDALRAAARAGADGSFSRDRGGDAAAR